MDNKLCEILPIIEKAAPVLSLLLKTDKLNIVVGLLGLLVNCNPHDEDNLIQKLKDDHDIFAKLKNLENTHKDWLSNL